MLTREQIEKVRSVYKRHFSDCERLDDVCDMALSALAPPSITFGQQEGIPSIEFEGRNQLIQRNGPPSGLVERLRERAKSLDEGGGVNPMVEMVRAAKVMREAADALEGKTG